MMTTISITFIIFALTVNLLTQGYNKHLLDVKETYFRHMRVALVAAIVAAVSVPVLIIHGLWPACFPKLGGDLLMGAAGIAKRWKR